jgi:hypothetical protein
MSPILDTAISRLRQMPEDRQEIIARLMLHEIEEDERWTRTTTENERKLKSLIDEVISADDRGECKTLDPDQL